MKVIVLSHCLQTATVCNIDFSFSDITLFSHERMISCYDVLYHNILHSKKPSIGTLLNYFFKWNNDIMLRKIHPGNMKILAQNGKRAFYRNQSSSGSRGSKQEHNYYTLGLAQEPLWSSDPLCASANFSSWRYPCRNQHQQFDSVALTHGHIHISTKCGEKSSYLLRKAHKLVLLLKLLGLGCKHLITCDFH